MLNLISECNTMNINLNHQSGTEEHFLTADQRPSQNPCDCDPDCLYEPPVVFDGETDMTVTSVTNGGPAIGNEVKVTVLPPGEAEGARDMQHWSFRRMRGKSGLPMSRKERRKRKPKLDPADRWLAKHDPRRR
jgi:hypothetical protein